MHGARVSLFIGFFAPFLYVLFGVVYGSTAGFIGGVTDQVLMRFADFVVALPFLLFGLYLRGEVRQREEQQVLEVYLPRWADDAGRKIAASLEDASRAGWYLVKSAEAALRPDTALVSLMHANNETGVLQPIREVAALARSRGIPVHTDTAQSVGQIPADVDVGNDMLAFDPEQMRAALDAGGELGRNAGKWSTEPELIEADVPPWIL